MIGRDTPAILDALRAALEQVRESERAAGRLAERLETIAAGNVCHEDETSQVARLIEVAGGERQGNV